MAPVRSQPTIMQRLTLAELESCRDSFDAMVEADPQLDRYCSRTEWILPFHRAFHSERELYLYRSNQAFVALAANPHAGIGHHLEALECMWGFGCPLVGPGASELLPEILAGWRNRPFGPPAVLTGIPLAGPLTRGLVGGVRRSHELRIIDLVTRYVASLEGGMDGFLRRRSSAFRRNLRSAQRKLGGFGLRFQRVARVSSRELPDLYRRILRIERLSWKASTGNGADQGCMKAFYQDMLPRLARRDGLRVVFARQDGCDVGYVSGAVIGDHYRGLQFSFDARLSKLSLGNVLQYQMLEWLCEDGFATYDLGSQSQYKRRWAEEGLSTATVLLLPRRGSAA